MKRSWLFLFLLPFLTFSQDFKNEDYIYLKRHENINIERSKGDFVIKKNVVEQAEYLTANKLYFANEALGYDSFTSIENIDAFTYLPSKDETVKVDYIETKRAFDNGIFYSDQESKNFTFPAVSKGAITNLSYTQNIKDPRFLGLYRFATFVPTKSAKLSITTPKNVDIGYIDFHTDDYPITFKKEELKNTNTYTWTVENIQGFQSEDRSESVLYYLPHIVVYIKSFEEKGKIETVLKDVNDLYKWYASLVAQIDTKNLDNIYAIAEKISEQASTQHEKAEAIFNWVQNNITYVAFEDGLGGFIPRGAAGVVEKRYGDCKDMANLLYEMLNHIGVKSYRTWIGTRDRPYSYLEVPTPMVDNHMINTVTIENDTIFLDATDSYVPFGMPSAFTQTKEALLGIDDKNFKLITVPIQKPEKSVSKIYSEFTMLDETVKVKEKRELSGYEKVDFVSKYTYGKADKTEEEFLNTTLALGNKKTNYDNITKANFDNTTKPLELNYDLSIDNYAKTVANKTYINLNIDRVLSKSKIDIDTRRFSKKIDNTFKKEYHTTFIIPDGFTAVDIPKDIDYNDPKYGFNISYSQEGNKIIQTKIIYVNTLSVKNNEFENWNNFIKNLIKAYKKSLTIEKI